MKNPAKVHTIRSKMPTPKGHLLRISDRLHLIVYCESNLDLVVVIRLDGAGNKETVLHGTFAQMEKSIHTAIKDDSSLLPDLKVAQKSMRKVKEDASKS